MASKTEKNLQLVNLHDLECTVAIGDYFLKQQSLLAVRAYLARVGVEQNLGKDWNPGNVYWKQAEDVLVAGADAADPPGILQHGVVVRGVDWPERPRAQRGRTWILCCGTSAPRSGASS